MESQEHAGSALEAFTRDITKLAEENRLDPVIGRDEEIRRVIQILSRRTKNNPVLLGDPGVGKTAIVEGLAQRIVKRDVPGTLLNKKVLALDMATLLAGAAYRGAFEGRLKKLVEEIEKSDGEYILFIDELHTIVGAGAAEGAVDAGNILKPALARGLLRTIGATTLREYRQYIEKDPALERRFQPVYVNEPSKEDALAILRGIKEKYELHHGVKISDNALVAAVELSSRYIPDRFLPDKAIDLLDEAASSASIALSSQPRELDTVMRRLMQIDIELAALKKEKGVEERIGALEKEKEELAAKKDTLLKRWDTQKKLITSLQEKRTLLEKKRAELEKAQMVNELERAAELKYGIIPSIEKEIAALEEEFNRIPKEELLIVDQVTEEDIARVVSQWTGIPATRLLSKETEKLKHLEHTLKQQVIGQDHALAQIAHTIQRSRTGLAEPGKPLGSFLFLGPTGVGKTETAKALARELFNDEKAIIRIDMSEYSEAHSVARLIGAPPGYVGYEEGGQLTEAVRRKPYSVVLFDEVEKAHPQIFNALLQILDDGRLTDGKGRTVSFTHTIIILTSNLGSEYYDKEKDAKKREQLIMEAIRRFFRPEFINRLDSIVIFNEMSEGMAAQIVEKELQKVIKRLEEQKIYLEVGAGLKKHLREVGFDPVYGARPLKRAITNLLTNAIAEAILKGELTAGNIVAEYKDGTVVLLPKTLN